MQVTDELVERAAKALEKRIKQSTYGWSDEQFEIWWNKDFRFVQHENSWGDAFGRGTQKDHLQWKVRIALEAALSHGEDTAPAELLDSLKFAVARVRVANAEGDPILSAWLPGADAIIAKFARGADVPKPLSGTGSGDAVLDALRRAESFMTGFEGDPLQEGIDDDLEAIRSAIACLKDGVAASTEKGPAHE
ncbi:hypothetical protein [Shinella sp. HZN7]|uniref:hypothetical protein n=1 Tax=Shinella sp. (strain HZN7) TaxID=879274 RepID=UPI0007DA95D2|nr:hypothetical protein [Shinella sp. HZN7]ANH08566.1 hypothetical protein shn_30940 [Shinella sp. HZN7]